MDLTNTPTVAANWHMQTSKLWENDTSDEVPRHWQTVPEGTRRRVSRKDFDRMKAEEIADLARWEPLGGTGTTTAAHW